MGKNMVVEFFRLSVKNLRYRKLRSWLTVLGVVIGVSLIVSLLFLGEGLKSSIMSQLRMFGTDLIFIFPGEESNPFLGMLSGLELEDKDVKIIKNIPGVDLVLPMNTKAVKVKFDGEEKSVNLAGNPWYETKEIYGKSQGFFMQSGDWPTKDNASELVLGSIISKDRFKKTIETGDELIIGARKMRVRGVLKATGDQGTDTMIYVSMENFGKITGKKSGAEQVVVKTKPAYDVDLVAENIKYELKKQRGGDEFAILTLEKTAAIVGDVLGIVEIILASIAIVALLVGGIGIMNTMFTAILERTREIGVMKAIGGSYTKIVKLFLIESGLVGLIGGVIGLVLGIFFAKGVELIAKINNFQFLDVSINISAIILILLFAFVFGMIAGFLPAHRAAKLNPAEALRKR
jgi:ABC-type antimicrobial peptide transport system permease subunit